MVIFLLKNESDLSDFEEG